MNTRSGRIIKKPQLYTNIKFKKGSGFKGCDHYDHSYSLKQKEQQKEKYKPGDYDYTDGFLVKDDEPIIYMSGDSDTEDEFIESDEETTKKTYGKTTKKINRKKLKSMIIQNSIDSEESSTEEEYDDPNDEDYIP